MFSYEAIKVYGATHGHLSSEQIQKQIEQQQFSFEEMARCLADAKKYPYIDILFHPLDLAAAGLLNEQWAKDHWVLPFAMDEQTVSIALYDPFQKYILEDVGLQISKRIIPHVANYQHLQKKIEIAYTDIRVFRYSTVSGMEISARSGTDARDLVDALLQQAYQRDASDIHIEPFAQGGNVRYRIDGVLYFITALDKKTLEALESCFKVLSNLDITEKRLPQEGHMEFNAAAEKLDCRVSTMPVVGGEKLVVRFIYRAKKLIHKSQLGFFETDIEKIDKLLNNNQGLILVTGPTGSGKTTTLASLLQDIDAASKNIIAIEDPVEHNLPGMNQIQVNEKVGLTFLFALRSILRQDPDIIMVGEIRDRQTVETTFKAAVTGHLVLSSLHTNDAIGAIVRLLDMGVEGYLIVSALKGVISQRLVRRLCPYCKKEEKISCEDAQHLGLEENTYIYTAQGCPYCQHRGYSGRFAVYEILILTQELSRFIVPVFRREEFYRYAHKAIQPMRENMLKNIVLGHTTIEEYFRVVYYDEV